MPPVGRSATGRSAADFVAALPPLTAGNPAVAKADSEIGEGVPSAISD